MTCLPPERRTSCCPTVAPGAGRTVAGAFRPPSRSLPMPSLWALGPGQHASRGVRLFLRHLRATGVITACVTDVSQPDPVLVTAFCRWMRQQRGTHFDAALLDLFLGKMDEVLLIKNRYADREGESAAPGEAGRPFAKTVFLALGSSVGCRS